MQSVHACTHSFTMQPTISVSGECIGNLFIVLQEKSDNFGPIIKPEINKLLGTVKNVNVCCSKSGKMSNRLINEWIVCLTDEFENIDCPTKVLLLLDSYKAHWNKNFDSSYDNWKFIIDKKRIPKETTSIAQPLDTYFNHELKFFVRKFNDRIRLDEIDINIKNRVTIIKLFSLIWDQISSIKFNNMIRYAWKSSEYIHENFEFKGVREICFESDSNDCDITDCDDCFFICCSHCHKNLCLNHFFHSYHVHYM